ncbi:MAG: hypothetical protein AB1758_38345 [Candidatus Eremiobacterota bacterium]
MNSLSPLGDWYCGYDEDGGYGGAGNTIKFCIADIFTVQLFIPAGATPSNTLRLEVSAALCPPQGPAAPPALVALSGAATNVGDPRPGRGSLKLSGKVHVAERLDLRQAALTIDALQHEVEGAAELVEGLPLVLFPAAGSKADQATFQSPPQSLPKVRLDLRLRNNQPAEFKLKVEQASLPLPPQRCAPQGEAEAHVTALALRLTLDDGEVLPLVIEGVMEVECEGEDPLLPEALKVRGLLPIEPQEPPFAE